MEHSHKHSLKKDDWYSRESLESAAELFSALSDPSRLRLMDYLSIGEACVTELADYCKESQSAVSHRLKLLRNARIVQRRREGKHIYYSLTDEHILSLLQNALVHVEEKSK
ncbi:MAG TPA: metalloregulator ArsR/SmtB family transcription factor [Leptospiraceae bacterium]|nr:metalloregulator ArsR/SmtB family transcription factor [Leptospiraceae bacterium]HMY66420.1 metalloregulator ArsR/SmtB family transcription factor [Leptospiraceae bacterium]HNF13094.1 metalloregulator ArsR/SmtB family transcription factor [Leptospiraceae bacterium]HNF23082.1 metalloregulator ArsR/SmtB family transcription factor [Leptospiraceae bacterium]HNI95909.1 metalloregulator ArsR/SmtB family transcription factor [Leptospiraceae bacterium]